MTMSFNTNNNQRFKKIAAQVNKAATARRATRRTASSAKRTQRAVASPSMRSAPSPSSYIASGRMKATKKAARRNRRRQYPNVWY